MDKYTMTLCWHCQKATGQCSWSENFKPVKGWTAEPTVITSHQSKYHTNYIDSYLVHACPEFVRDAPRKRYKPSDD